MSWELVIILLVVAWIISRICDTILQIVNVKTLAKNVSLAKIVKKEESKKNEV